MELKEPAQSRAVYEIIRGLHRDDRAYVLEARQGDRRAVAVIRASSPNPVLELAPQAHVRVSVVNSRGKAMKIDSVEIIEDIDGQEECSANNYHPWAHVKPAPPGRTVDVQVPPGPWRCLSVWWTTQRHTLESILIPAPLRAERIHLHLVVDSEDRL